MAERYTKKDAERCFIRLTDALGARRAKRFDDVGALQLDHQAVYGGVNIEQISNKGGGITHPFGSERLKPSEFCNAVRFAERALQHSKDGSLKGLKSFFKAPRKRKRRR
jgi:hypothetical protein